MRNNRVRTKSKLATQIIGSLLVLGASFLITSCGGSGGVTQTLNFTRFAATRTYEGGSPNRGQLVVFDVTNGVVTETATANGILGRGIRDIGFSASGNKVFLIDNQVARLHRFSFNGTNLLKEGSCLVQTAFSTINSILIRGNFAVMGFGTNGVIPGDITTVDITTMALDDTTTNGTQHGLSTNAHAMVEVNGPRIVASDAGSNLLSYWDYNSSTGQVDASTKATVPTSDNVNNLVSLFNGNLLVSLGQSASGEAELRSYTTTGGSITPTGNVISLTPGTPVAASPRGVMTSRTAGVQHTILVGLPNGDVASLQVNSVGGFSSLVTSVPFMPNALTTCLVTSDEKYFVAIDGTGAVHTAPFLSTGAPDLTQQNTYNLPSAIAVDRMVRMD
ncbi:MAG: hypothetical protein KF812_01000 [Fimbriimonadaceae bacterium]|nr:hypothetical protein [Fimbriimonadaceae bacterium]